MPLNDNTEDEFSSQLDDEYGFDNHPPPGVEIGRLKTEPDFGSGSYAEDGPLEVAEDRMMFDGEAQLGSAAMYGPTEIGDDDELGFDHGSGYIAAEGASEIGLDHDVDEGRSEVGLDHDLDEGRSEVGEGWAPGDGQSEIGAAADVMAPFEGFMLDDVNMGWVDDDLTSDQEDEEYDEVGAASAADRDGSEIGYDGDDLIGDANVLDSQYEIGAADAADRYGSELGGGWAAAEGQSEIGAAAVVKVIEKARDNRQPPPPMRAVDVEAPVRDDVASWGLTDVFLGVAAKAGHPDPFPFTSQLLVRAGATTEPRFVRVDTEESYKQFRQESSPELAALRQKLDEHIADPHAHGLSSDVTDSDLTDDIEDIVLLGEEVAQKKRVEMWMPKRFDGKVEAWREGDFVCASIAIPGLDGQVRICTSLEPIRKCVTEMTRHAAESGVPAAAVVGVLPAMGCVLGAGTAIKEMAAAAPAILKRPEARSKQSFMVRIEPRTSPALAALAMLAVACRMGNKQAVDEWSRLGAASPGPVKQAMSEALQLAKAME